MKRKPLHIDWDELESAFENRNEDLSYYLDLITGKVFMIRPSSNNGELLKYHRYDNGSVPAAAAVKMAVFVRSTR